MAFSLNKVQLIGNLGRDAETRQINDNFSVTNFSIATTHSYKDKNEQWQDETTWHNITGFNLSDFFKSALTKGKKFFIEGRIQKKEYNDKDGNKRYSFDVITEKIIPLEPSENSGDRAGSVTAPVTDEAPF